MEDNAAKQKYTNNQFKRALETLKDYVKAMNENDLEETMSKLHKNSPAQLPTRYAIGPLMSTYKLYHRLLDPEYIGANNDYLFLRMKQKNRKLNGPEFQNNISDLLVAMKQDEGIWKIWNMMALETVNIQND
jgi:hypothetical protein